MKQHTTSFKNEIKLLGKQQKVQIIYGENVLDEENINSVNFYYQGDLLKSIMKGLNIDSNINIPKDTELALKYGLLVNGEYEYIDYGKFIVYEVEKQEDTNSYAITCYDKLLYSMKDYEAMDITYPITVENYLKEIAAFLKLDYSSKNKSFANYDKIITSELYLDNTGADLGYTFRDVLDEIAQVTASIICINNNDELEIRYINNTEDVIDEEFLKDINVNFGQKYGPINSVVLSRSAESDNIYMSNEESIIENGLCEIKIIDNQIMNFNNRDEFLPDIFNKLNGIEYYINDFSSTGIMYYDILDKYNIKIGENIYNCLMLNDEINITQGLEEIIYTNMPKNSETNYTKSDKTDRRINQAYIIVDKQNRKIEAVVSETEEQKEKISEISQTVDEISSKVNEKVDISISKESKNAKIILENIYESEPLYIKVYPINEHISYLYPSNNLYPSDNLFPKSRTLRFTNTYRNEIIDYKLPCDLLYYDEENYDEFILDYENLICKVNKKVGRDINGITFLLNEPKTIEYEYPKILLSGGSYEITLLGYEEGYIFARLLISDVDINKFATKVELESEITQLSNSINLEVSKKVDNDEIIARINMAVQGIEEDENGNIPKDVEKSIMEFIANKISIDSDHLKMTKEGILTLLNNTSEPYIFTEADAINVLNYIKGDITLTDEMLEIYDVNNDGNVNIIDAVEILNSIKGEGSITKYATTEFKLDLTNPSEFIKMLLAGQTKFKIGANEIYSQFFRGLSIFLGTYSGTNEIYGILLDGEKGKFKITNQDAITETVIDAGMVDAYNVKASSGGGKGYCLHGIDESHTYRCNWGNVSGTNFFEVYVDQTQIPLIKTVPNNAEQISQMRLQTSYIEFIVPGYGAYSISGIAQSDTKLKDNIKDSKVNALDIINKIRHIEFDWKDCNQSLRTGHEEIGHSANQINETIGNDIAYSTKQPDNMEYNELLQIDYDRLMPYITKAIQELDDKYEKQQKTIDFLIEKLGCKEELEKYMKGEK